MKLRHMMFRISRLSGFRCPTVPAWPRLWLPKDAHERPVPAIIEYIPYRRRDGLRDWDQLTHPWFAARGYACLSIDIRGSGDSEGVILDEYLKQEQDDALDAIEWIAAQPWCSGKVGMMGISWGGFNGLQVAARRPPALKAIITVCSTDDCYADDINYMGGRPQRQSGLGCDVLHLYGPPTGSSHCGRALARDVAGPAGTAAPVLRDLDGASARIFQRTGPNVAGLELPASGDHRSVGPEISAYGCAGTCHRISSGGGTVVGSLAERQGHRHHGGANAARLSSRRRRAPRTS